MKNMLRNLTGPSSARSPKSQSDEARIKLHPGPVYCDITTLQDKDQKSQFAASPGLGPRKTRALLTRQVLLQYIGLSTLALWPLGIF